MSREKDIKHCLEGEYKKINLDFSLNEWNLVHKE
jgi:hypothetical protein